MSWADFLYTKGITEANLTAEQRGYWHGLWEKEYGPPKLETAATTQETPKAKEE